MASTQQQDVLMSSTDHRRPNSPLSESEEMDDGDLQPPSKDADRPVPPASEEDVDLQPAAANAKSPPRKRKRPAKAPEQHAANSPPARKEKTASAKIAAPEQHVAKSPPARKKKTASGETAPTATEQPAAKSPPARKKKTASRERRTWPPDDEVQILRALVEHRRQHGDLPEKLDDIIDSIAGSLQDKGWELRAIKDKVRSLQRRYDNNAVSTTPHEEHLHRLSDEIWGGLHRPEDGTEAQQRSFEEMCELYPNIAKEVKKLAEVQPTLTTSLSRLDDRRARTIEEKLAKVSSIEVKIQMQLGTKVEAPKAKIRKKLVNLLVKLAKDV